MDFLIISSVISSGPPMHRRPNCFSQLPHFILPWRLAQLLPAHFITNSKLAKFTYVLLQLNSLCSFPVLVSFTQLNFSIFSLLFPASQHAANFGRFDYSINFSLKFHHYSRVTNILWPRFRIDLHHFNYLRFGDITSKVPCQSNLHASLVVDARNVAVECPGAVAGA